MSSQTSIVLSDLLLLVGIINNITAKKIAIMVSSIKGKIFSMLPLKIHPRAVSVKTIKTLISSFEKLPSFFICLRISSLPAENSSFLNLKAIFVK